jgi:ferrochelatase
MAADRQVGVVLLQLGGPDTLASVEPFLTNLFSDPDIIDLPLAFLFRNPLARFIARRRGPKVQEYYRRIGGGSPILRLTNRQARALEAELRSRLPVRVYVAMRYWHPLTEAAVDALIRDGIRKVILLPLYPHYSKTTTGSSVNEWNRVVRKKAVTGLEVAVVEQYCEHPSYIGAIVQNVARALNRVPAPDRQKVHLVFSAHGTPVKLVESGDPYRDQIVRTYEAVTRAGAFGLPHHLCFQSKVGPQRWLEPSLEDTVRRLAKEGASHLLVIPIAFVSDHSETLWEINIQVREEALALGIRYYDMMPALHTNPLFIRALADCVTTAAGR